MLDFLFHLKGNGIDPSPVHPLLDAGLHPPDLVQLVLVHVPQVLDDLQHQLRALSYPVHPVLGQRVRHVVADELCATVYQHLLGQILLSVFGSMISNLRVVHLAKHPDFKGVVFAQRLKDSRAAEVDQLQDLGSC